MKIHKKPKGFNKMTDQEKIDLGYRKKFSAFITIKGKKIYPKTVFVFWVKA